MMTSVGGTRGCGFAEGRVSSAVAMQPLRSLNVTARNDAVARARSRTASFLDGSELGNLANLSTSDYRSAAPTRRGPDYNQLWQDFGDNGGGDCHP